MNMWKILLLFLIGCAHSTALMADDGPCPFLKGASGQHYNPPDSPPSYSMAHNPYSPNNSLREIYDLKCNAYRFGYYVGIEGANCYDALESFNRNTAIPYSISLIADMFFVRGCRAGELDK